MGRTLAMTCRRLQAEAALFVAAVVLPVVLWHATVAKIAHAFRPQFTYLVAGWAPWVLMTLGLACFVPVLLERARDPERRFPGPALGPWYGWATTLYLLGFLLATQVAQIAEGISSL